MQHSPFEIIYHSKISVIYLATMLFSLLGNAYKIIHFWNMYVAFSISNQRDVSKEKESNISHGKNPFYKSSFSRGRR